MTALSTSYINIHTHHPPENDTVAILNVIPGLRFVAANPMVSAGIHPWNISKGDTAKNLELLHTLASHTHVKAIGECGLDRLIDTGIKEQKTIFIEQINIATVVKKPLIIHCVKAHDELIHIKKEQKINVPAIIHGYNNNEIIAKQLLQQHFYLSFGKALLIENSNAQKIIKTLDCENFFLETDDSDASIQVIFAKAAALKNIPVEELKEKMMLNFKHIFGHE